MDTKTFMTFQADFPDDGVDGEGEDLDVPAGQTICNALAAMLREQRLEASDPEQHSFYGWAIFVTAGLERFWFMIQFPEPWLLIAKDETGLLGRIRRKTSRFPEVLDRLALQMQADRRFSELNRYTKDEYERSPTA